MKEHYFDDLKAGDRFQSETLEVPGKAIIEFAEKFDPQMFHLNPKSAERSIFKGLVASGWHTAAITMRLFVRKLNFTQGAIGLGVDELRWPANVAVQHHVCAGVAAQQFWGRRCAHVLTGERRGGARRHHPPGGCPDRARPPHAVALPTRERPWRPPRPPTRARRSPRCPRRPPDATARPARSARRAARSPRAGRPSPRCR